MLIDRATYPNLSAGLDAHVATCSHPWAQTAQALNFLSDARSSSMTDFANELEIELGASGIPLAAKSFFDTSIAKLRPPSSRWLGLIESPLAWDDGFTYLSFKDINNYLIDAPLSSPPPRINLSKPLKYNVINSTPVKRFIWVTDPSSQSMPTGNEVVRSLGLPHYGFDDIIYRVKLTLTGKKLYVPTALDSEIGEAWCFPHIGDPTSCGLMRHLESGVLSCPELLTEVSDHIGDSLVAELVGTLPTLNVGTYILDFLVGRPVQKIADYMT